MASKMKRRANDDDKGKVDMSRGDGKASYTCDGGDKRQGKRKNQGSGKLDGKATGTSLGQSSRGKSEEGRGTHKPSKVNEGVQGASSVSAVAATGRSSAREPPQQEGLYLTPPKIKRNSVSNKGRRPPSEGGKSCIIIESSDSSLSSLDVPNVLSSKGKVENYRRGSETDTTLSWETPQHFKANGFEYE